MDAQHPDRNALERFSRGETAAIEERWIENHLRSGCARCQREVDALLPSLFQTVPALVGPAPAHVPARPLDPLDPPANPEDAAWDRLFSALEQRLVQATAEQDEAPALLAGLLDRPAGERSVLLRLDRRLQTLAVCEQLIERSFEEGFRDAGGATELAQLGLQLAGLLDGERYGRSVVQDLQARAWAYLGNARRIAFDLTGAEEALARAERLAEGGSADPLEEARILDLRASLLSDQGRFEQAAELLDVVIDIYDDLRELHRKGRAMISKGVFLGYSGWPEEAIRQIRKGLGLVDWERERRLVLIARHNLAWFLNDCGRTEDALRQLERFRHSYREFSDSWTGLRLAWLDGRIAGRLGRPAEAETTLREVRRQLPRRGRTATTPPWWRSTSPASTWRRAASARCARSPPACSTSSSPRTSTARPSPRSPSSSRPPSSTPPPPAWSRRSPPTCCGPARTRACASRRRRRRKPVARRYAPRFESSPSVPLHTVEREGVTAEVSRAETSAPTLLLPWLPSPPVRGAGGEAPKGRPPQGARRLMPRIRYPPSRATGLAVPAHRPHRHRPPPAPRRPGAARRSAAQGDRRRPLRPRRGRWASSRSTRSTSSSAPTT